MTAIYRYDDRDYTLAQLRVRIESEVAALPKEQWRDGRFYFKEWLPEAISAGVVKEV